MVERPLSQDQVDGLIGYRELGHVELEEVPRDPALVEGGTSHFDRIPDVDAEVVVVTEPIAQKRERRVARPRTPRRVSACGHRPTTRRAGSGFAPPRPSLHCPIARERLHGGRALKRVDPRPLVTKRLTRLGLLAGLRGVRQRRASQAEPLEGSHTCTDTEVGLM